MNLLQTLFYSSYEKIEGEKEENFKNIVSIIDDYR